MRAIVTTPHRAGAVALVDRPEPEPMPFQALVQVAASSVNRGEVRRLGVRPHGFASGWDVAGTVVRAAADGSGPPEGARVVGLVPYGRWAERVAVPTAMLRELPEEIDLVTAAAIPIAGLTALRALVAGGALLGRRVLVTGAAGRVGRFYRFAGARVCALLVFSEPMREGSAVRDLGTPLTYVGEGRIDPQVADVLPWDQASTAFGRLLRRDVPGKLVLTMEEGLT